jgi:hypothetical protein
MMATKHTGFESRKARMLSLEKRFVKENVFLEENLIRRAEENLIQRVEEYLIR